MKAWRLPYASQREDIFGRTHRRIAKANERLGRMSKYARTPTRQRQWDRIAEAEDQRGDGTARDDGGDLSGTEHLST